MTEKRFIDIEIGAGIGQIRLYTTNEDYETYGSEDILNLLNEQHEENEDLESEVYVLQDDILNKRVRNLIKENEQLKEELDYYKNKCASLETGLIQVERTNLKLQEENQILRKNLSDKDIEWIRNNTVWEQMPTNQKTYIRTDKND